MYTQRAWVQRTNASQPGPLLGPKLVYDDARHTVILYGGYPGAIDPDQASASMWELTTSGWQQLCSACLPGPRGGHAMAYDAVRDRIVLYGGADDLDDAIYEWSGPGNGTWTRIAPTGAGPGTRRNAALVYDRAQARMLLVGGETEDQQQASDVWLYKEGAWAAQALGSVSPSRLAGDGTSATYDPALGVVALADDRGNPRDEVWAWNDGWRQVCGSCTGLSRVAGSLVYDPTLKSTYLVTGFNGTEIDGTWRLQGSSFQKLNDLPRGRDSEGVVYDAARDVIVLYGGNGKACQGNCNETWEFQPAP